MVANLGLERTGTLRGSGPSAGQALRRPELRRFAGASPRLEVVLANAAKPRKAGRKVLEALETSTRGFLINQGAAAKSSDAATAKSSSPGPPAKSSSSPGSTKSSSTGSAKGSTKAPAAAKTPAALATMKASVAPAAAKPQVAAAAAKRPVAATEAESAKQTESTQQTESTKKKKQTQGVTMPAWLKVLEAAHGPKPQAIAKKARNLLLRGGLEGEVKENVVKALMPLFNKGIGFKSKTSLAEATSGSRQSGRRKPLWQQRLEESIGKELFAYWEKATASKKKDPNSRSGPSCNGKRKPTWQKKLSEAPIKQVRLCGKQKARDSVKAEPDELQEELEPIARRTSGRHRPKWLEEMVGKKGFKQAEAKWRSQVRTAQAASWTRLKKEEAEAKLLGLSPYAMFLKRRSGSRKKGPKIELSPSQRKRRRLVKAIARHANVLLGRRSPPLRRRPGRGPKAKEPEAAAEEGPAPGAAAEAVNAAAAALGLFLQRRSGDRIKGRSTAEGDDSDGERTIAQLQEVLSFS